MVNRRFRKKIDFTPEVYLPAVGVGPDVLQTGPPWSRVCTYCNRPRLGPASNPRPITRGCLLTKRPPLPRSVSALMCPANGPLESRVCTYRNRPRLGPASNTNPRPITRGCLLTGPLYNIYPLGCVTISHSVGDSVLSNFRFMQGYIP